MARKRQDDIDTLHGYEMYSPTRTVFLTGEVDETMYKTVVKNLLILDSSNASSPINILINSNGGDFGYCRAIYDMIKGCKNYVRGIVIGDASSSASVILQACDERLMLPNSKIMIHAGEVGVEGHPQIVRRWIKSYDKDEQWMNQVYLEKIINKNADFTKERLKELLKFDTILDADKAVELGLADRKIEQFDFY